LQKELFERKFNVLEYFMWMFRILRVFIWENKLWVTGFVLSNILIGIMPVNFVNKYLFMSTVLVYYGRIFIFISYAKVLHRIESTENEYKFTKSDFKWADNWDGICSSVINIYSLLYSDICRAKYENVAILKV